MLTETSTSIINTEGALIPAIRSYFTNGIPISELHISAPQKAQLNAVINAWNFYQQQPWQVNNIRAYFRAVGRTPQQIQKDLQYFDYIKSHFSPYTKQDLTNVATFGAMQAMKSASMAGDRQDQLKAASLLDRIASRIPDEAEDISKSTARLPIIIHGDVQRVDKERSNTDYDQKLALMKKYGATPDQTAQMMHEKELLLRGIQTPQEDELQEMQYEPTEDE